MSPPSPSQFTRWWGSVAGLITALSLLGGESFQGRAAEPVTPPSLDQFLKRAGFEGIEYRIDDREALVQGRLGNKNRTFLLDTGWALTTLDAHAARGLKTLGELNVKLDDSLGGRLSDPDIVLMEELTLGRAKFLNQPAKVRELKPEFTGWRYDGVLGFDFYYRNHCLVDCGGRRLYVRGSKPSEAVADTLAKSLRLSRFVEVPMAGRYGTTVDVEINGQTVKLLVDTGAFATILDDSQLPRLGLTKLKYTGPRRGSQLLYDAGTTAVGVAGLEAMYVSDVKSFRIASQPWKDVQVGVGDLAKWQLAKAGTQNQEIQGLLGIDLLVIHSALIDFTSNRLWFRPER